MTRTLPHHFISPLSPSRRGCRRGWDGPLPTQAGAVAQQPRKQSSITCFLYRMLAQCKPPRLTHAAVSTASSVSMLYKPVSVALTISPSSLPHQPQWPALALQERATPGTGLCDRPTGTPVTTHPPHYGLELGEVHGGWRSFTASILTLNFGRTCCFTMCFTRLVTDTRLQPVTMQNVSSRSEAHKAHASSRINC